MVDFFGLLGRYGWHLALVGLLGTIIVGSLKRPLNAIIAKKFPPDTNPITDSKFDTIAFLLGFAVAMFLAIFYSALASANGWVLSEVDGEMISQKLRFGSYIANILGVWTFQTVYYSVWKKLGLKRILIIAWGALKRAIIRFIDKNNDGAVDFAEAAETIQGLLRDGTLNIHEVLRAAESAVPGVVDEIVSTVSSEAGDAAIVDMDANVDSLALLAQQLTAAIPADKVSAVASAAVDVAAAKLKASAKAQKPVINF